jgi:hypothetical protein
VPAGHRRCHREMPVPVPRRAADRQGHRAGATGANYCCNVLKSHMRACDDTTCTAGLHWPPAAAAQHGKPELALVFLMTPASRRPLPGPPAGVRRAVSWPGPCRVPSFRRRGAAQPAAGLHAAQQRGGAGGGPQRRRRPATIQTAAPDVDGLRGACTRLQLPI